MVAGGTEGNLAAQILVHPVTVAVERAGGDYDGMVCLGADHLAIVVDRPHDDCAARLVLDDVSDLGGCHLFHVVIGFHMVVYERDDAALHGLVAWEGGGAPYGPGRPAGQVVVIACPCGAGDVLHPNERVAHKLPQTLRERAERIAEEGRMPIGVFQLGGVSGFLFLDKSGMPCVAMHWEHRMSRAVARYNRIYREPLPKITPHMCRHSFATRMARNGMSPVRLKYIMGHADIATTYNIYTHLGFEDVRDEVLRIEREGL